ncbi:MAG TPA: YigZ family protein, partial [Chloroflexota bacterium]|nr:YigZ family protein [Chloroflexota bacterium]
MHSPYRTVVHSSSIEIEAKKSCFICTVARATSEDEARSFIANLKKQHWDANHNCSAYV